MAITPERWSFTNAYAGEVFGTEPEHIRSNREAAAAAGIPNWAVTPELGRLLATLVRATGGETGLEIGTLGGYSTLWLLEGMAPGGRIITVEVDEDRAAFAESEFKRLGVSDRVDLRRGNATELLDGIADELGPSSVDVVFVDADKESYPYYYETTAELMKPGGLLLIDNIFGTSVSWVDDLSDPRSEATDRMNRRAAADDRFDTAGVFVRSGLLIARRK